jgi:stress response protein YsnF
MTDSFGASSTSAYGSTANAGRTVAAMFQTRDGAQRAVEALVEEGFDRSDINLVEGNQASTGYSDSYQGSGEGFWASLKDLFFPDEDRHVYAEGLRRGGYLVSVRAPGESYDRAVDILDDEGTIDLDEREASWRSQGWSGYTGSDYNRTATAPDTPALSATPAAGGMNTASAGYSDRATGVTANASGSTTARQGEAEEVIPIVEERLQVGKRVTEGGRVRVRSYVVEEPVSEQVNLREEHVSVQRRPVDLELTGDVDPFRERTFELDEKSEQAVVAKEARIREELVVKKDVETRNETVNDTVRRTEVDVQDDRNARVSGTGTTGEPTRR